MTDRETADEIEDGAARWVWRLDREGRTPELEAELVAWRAADPRREGAFLQAEAAWMTLDRGAQLAPLSRRRPPPSTRSGLHRRQLVVGGGAAVAASLAGVAFVALSSERYATAVGEIRRVPLKDGSTAAINTQSDVEVAMTPKARLVKIARGEAWFQVARNPERPFIVEVGRVRVQAVGTAFSVRRREGGAEVLVNEGVVEAWAVGAEGHVVRIAVGERAFVADNAAVREEVAGASEIDRALAWRAGKIDLAGETLAAAAGEFNRYNTRKLIVRDPAFAQERLYGVFRIDDPEGFARSVRQSFGVEIDLRNTEEILIGADVR